MNRDCHGDWFLFDENPHYQCFADSQVFQIERNTEKCPGCDRKIIGIDQRVTQRDVLQRKVMFADGRETVVASEVVK